MAKQEPAIMFSNEAEAKLPMRVTIRTSQENITGTIHVQPEHRMLDELNGPDSFLAVTGAEIEAGAETVRSEFVAVNKDHIIWVKPIQGAPAA